MSLVKESIGCGGKVFAIFWTAFSSIFLFAGLALTWKSLAEFRWDTVPCVIDRFEITGDPSGKPAFRADLAYRYEVGGRHFTGNRLWKDKEGSEDYEDLEEIRMRFSRGPEGPLAEISGVPAECRVKPGEPETSVLETSGLAPVFGGLAFAAFGGFFVLIGVAIFFTEKGGGERKAVSNRGKSNMLPAVIGFLFFECIGLAVIAGLVLPKAIEWTAMRGWQETDAEIIWSRVRTNRGSDSTTYAADLFYRYRVADVEYRSNRYSLMGGSSSGIGGKREVVDAHPPGSTLRVYVDPDEPWHAVVERNPGWMGLFALFPLPFLAVGFFGLRWAIRKHREGPAVSRPRGGHVAAARVRRTGPAPLAAGEWTRAGPSRVGTFVALLIFALFWNGLLAFSQRDLWSGGGGSGFDTAVGGIFTLFMVPFFLIGIGVAAGAVYTLAAVFAPRFEVQLAGGDLKPGGSVRLQWRRAGGFGETRDFSLLLIGREEATYSQGSSNSTARSIFHEEVLFETAVPQAMASGGVSLRIPADSVPTFHGTDNRMVWHVCLRAKVPWLPDLRDEREVIVLPPEPTEMP